MRRGWENQGDDMKGVPGLKEGEVGGESDPVNGRVRKFVCMYKNNLKTQQKIRKA